MPFCSERLWHCDKADQLLVIVPGTTGIGFPSKRGFAYIAGDLWAHGISVYLGNTDGQDGRYGAIDMAAWATSIQAEIEELRFTHDYPTVHFFGTCLGGPVAATCAHVFGSQLFLWETALAYSTLHRKDFIRHCVAGKVRLADKFWDSLIELKQSISRDSKVTFFHGSQLQLPFTSEDLSELKEQFSDWRFLEVVGADHGLPRGSNPKLLPSLCSEIKGTIHSNK